MLIVLQISEILILGFFEYCNCYFVLFWLGMKGIRYESIVFVIMEWWGNFQNAGILNVLVLIVFVLRHTHYRFKLCFWPCHFATILYHQWWSHTCLHIYHAYYIWHVLRFFYSPELLVQYSIYLELSSVFIHQMQYAAIEWHLMRLLGNVVVSMMNLLYNVFLHISNILTVLRTVDPWIVVYDKLILNNTYQSHSIMALEITTNSIVCSKVIDANITENINSALLAFCEGICQYVLDYTHNGPVMQRVLLGWDGCIILQRVYNTWIILIISVHIIRCISIPCDGLPDVDIYS